jgi:hypothetical protein
MLCFHHTSLFPFSFPFSLPEFAQIIGAALLEAPVPNSVGWIVLASVRLIRQIGGAFLFIVG